MELTFLGTGTSHGIPEIGCQCPVCTSSDSHNKRRRASVYVRDKGTSLLVDTPPDFREQVLSFGVERVDAVLVTHPHADHIFGFDDLRRFYDMQGQPIPIYSSVHTIEVLKRVFAYVDGDIPPGASVLRVDFREVSGPWRIGQIDIEPLTVDHGWIEACGYLFRAGGKSLAYVPDCNGISSETLAQIQGVDVMILDALRRTSHPTHFSLPETVSCLEKIGAQTSYITHLSHDLDHDETRKILPASVQVPYDGLTITL